MSVSYPRSVPQYPIVHNGRKESKSADLHMQTLHLQRMSFYEEESGIERLVKTIDAANLERLTYLLLLAFFVALSNNTWLGPEKQLA